MTPVRRSILLMIAFLALWVVIEALAGKLAMQYSAYQVVWTRYGVHLAFMVLALGWRSPKSLVSTNRPALQLLRAVMMVAMPASFIAGFGSGISFASFMTVFSVCPLVLLSLAAIFLRDRARLYLWTSAILAMVGTTLILGDPSAVSPWLLAFPLAMAMSLSLYIVMTRMLKAEATRTNLFYTAGVVFVVLTPFMPGLWVPPSPPDAAVMVAIGLLGLLALYCLDKSAGSAPVSVAAPIVGAEPVFATILSWRHGNQFLNFQAFAGLLLFCIAAFLAWWGGQGSQCRKVR